MAHVLKNNIVARSCVSAAVNVHGDQCAGQFERFYRLVNTNGGNKDYNSVEITRYGGREYRSNVYQRQVWRIYYLKRVQQQLGSFSCDQQQLSVYRFLYVIRVVFVFHFSFTTPILFGGWGNTTMAADPWWEVSYVLRTLAKLRHPVSLIYISVWVKHGDRFHSRATVCIVVVLLIIKLFLRTGSPCVVVGLWPFLFSYLVVLFLFVVGQHVSTLKCAKLKMYMFSSKLSSRWRCWFRVCGLLCIFFHILFFYYNYTSGAFVSWWNWPSNMSHRKWHDSTNRSIIICIWILSRGQLLLLFLFVPS